MAEEAGALLCHDNSASLFRVELVMPLHQRHLTARPIKQMRAVVATRTQRLHLHPLLLIRFESHRWDGPRSASHRVITTQVHHERGALIVLLREAGLTLVCAEER